MNKRISLSFALLTILNITVYSQERVSKPLPKIGAEIFGQLTNATGWTFNPESQWVSKTNKIPYFIESKYSSLIDYEQKGLGIDNFISYQLRDIKIKDSTFAILIKKYKDGYFEYPSISEGWQNYTSVMFYTFSKSELKKLENIKLDEINLVQINILYSNNISWTKDETYLQDIQNEIIKQMDEKQKEVEKEKYLVFHVAPYKAKNIVQFQIYSSYSKYKIIGGIMNEHKIKDEKGKYSWEEKQIYLTSDLFKHCYFETEYSTFNSLVKLPK